MHLIEMCERPDFIDGVAAIREKWQISPDELDDSERVLKIEDRSIHDDVLKLLKQLDIPEHWSEIVHIYVVEDSMYPYFDTNSYLTRIETGVKLYQDMEHPGKSYVVAGIDGTKEELKEAWDDLIKITGTTRRKRRNTAAQRGNFLRDFKIVQLAKNGKSVDEIYSTITKEFGDIEYGNIRKVVTEFCDRAKIPKSDRPRISSHRKSGFNFD